jgi:hypothetical protein
MTSFWRSLNRLEATVAASATMAAVTALIVAAGCASTSRQSRNAPAGRDDADAREAARLARLLENSETRDAAACRLFELLRYRGPGKPQYEEDRCDDPVRGAVNHVIVAPQESASRAGRSSVRPMYLVFRRWPYDKDDIGPGKSKGPFSLIDNDGFLVPAFMGANMVDEDGKVIPYAGDGRLAIAQTITQAGGGEGDEQWHTDVVHIVPIAPEQRSILSVVFGPTTYGFDDSCKGFSWGWRTRDADADGIPEIEVGPRLDEKTPDNISPRAIYRWSRATSRYEGPRGSVEDGFLRIDDVQDVVRASDTPGPQSCCYFYKHIERFTDERRQRSLAHAADPSAFRRSRCETFTFTGESVP